MIFFTVSSLCDVCSVAFQCILSDKKKKKIYHTEDMVNFTEKSVVFVPSYITFHPSSAKFVMAYDSTTEKVNIFFLSELCIVTFEGVCGIRP